MSYYLYLLRHAQSADKQIGQKDKERILTSIGLRDANAVGNFLKEKSIIPQLIVSSSAVRATTTSKIVAETIHYKSEDIILKDDLYDADVPTLLHILSNFDNATTRVMIVGHNPGISFLINHIVKGIHINLSPCELVIIKLELTTWKEIDSTNGKLEIRYPGI